MCPWRLWTSLLGHIAQILSLGFNCWVEKPCFRRKTPLVVGGTWTHFLADSMTIAVRALNHCPLPRHQKSLSVLPATNSWGLLIYRGLTQLFIRFQSLGYFVSDNEETRTSSEKIWVFPSIATLPLCHMFLKGQFNSKGQMTITDFISCWQMGSACLIANNSLLVKFSWMWQQNNSLLVVLHVLFKKSSHCTPP